MTFGVDSTLVKVMNDLWMLDIEHLVILVALDLYSSI